MIFPREALTRESVAAHYDELDGIYREVWGEHLHHGLWLDGREPVELAVLQLVELVAERLRPESGQEICDIGSGYGATARWFAREHGAAVTALTISEAQFDYATAAERREALHSPPGEGAAVAPTYLMRDWLDNRLADESFDAAYCIEGSEHMPDKAGFVSEAFRVLVPGGRFVVCAWLSMEDPRHLEVRYLLEPICREGRLPSLGTRFEYEDLLVQAGFRNVEFDDLTANVWRTWRICAGRLLKGLLTKPRFRSHLFNRGNVNRVFARSVVRIWIAYLVGSMRYGIFSAVRPASTAVRPASTAVVSPQRRG